MMLIEPASKVSDPVLVVNLIRSSVALSDLLPAQDELELVVAVRTPENAHMLVVASMRVRTQLPFILHAGSCLQESKNAEVVDASAPFVDDVEMYPVVSTPPESPICNHGDVDPTVLTPLSDTVIRLTHDGIPVKSLNVPEVVACAVPSVSFCCKDAGVNPVGVSVATGLPLSDQVAD
jgi:hypothetical protein